MMRVQIEGKSYSLGEFLDVFNRVMSSARCTWSGEDGAACHRLASLRQGTDGEPRCLEHAWVKATVH